MQYDTMRIHFFFFIYIPICVYNILRAEQMSIILYKCPPFCMQHFQMFFFFWQNVWTVKKSWKYLPGDLIISTWPWAQVMAKYHQATSQNLNQSLCHNELKQFITSRETSSGPSDAILRQRSASTLTQVIACCLTAPSHYLNQCWLIISKVEWHSSMGKFTRDNSAINHWNYLENWISKISFKFTRGQWVNTVVWPYWIQVEYLSIGHRMEHIKHHLDDLLVVVVDICKRKIKDLTHCGLVTPYGDKDLGQHWLR